MPGKTLEVGHNTAGEIVVNFEPDTPRAWHAVFTVAEAMEFGAKILRRAAEVHQAKRKRLTLPDATVVAEGWPPPEDGVSLIARERVRQVEEEGWDTIHDNVQHGAGQLARAGACYAMHDLGGKVRRPHWPWAGHWWKPKTPIRNLARAGALIAAEIDRRLRAGEQP